MTKAKAVESCQRWRAHRDTYRPAGEPINTSRYGVELIESDTLARGFVCSHHYSGSYPAARCRVGLYRMRELVGVAVFSVPMNFKTVQAYAPRLDHNEGVELGRFVLLDEVPANGETWFLARAFRILHEVKPGVRMVLSYSDPVPRRSIGGAVVLPGHVGTIYQAFNGRYVGRGRKRRLVLAPDGRIVSERALSKLRNGERGEVYAYEQLIGLGAPRRRPLEDPRKYVQRALSTGPFRIVRHPGNHVYLWSPDRNTRTSFPSALDYPKQIEIE